MAAVTGEVLVKFDGREYCLRLTMRGLSVLQTEFGNDVLEKLDSGTLPDISVLLRLVELALGKESERYEGDLADELLSADVSIVGRIVQAALPSAREGAAVGSAAGTAREKKVRAARA